MNGQSIVAGWPWRTGGCTRRRAAATALSVAALVVALLGEGCSSIRQPYSQADYAEARIAGMPHVRAWADNSRQPLLRFTTSAAPLTMLTLSGGGAEGAYGAGFLTGWSDSGSRPRPGIFAPTFIDVETDDKRFAEMHVDGSVISNVPAVPEALLLDKLPRRTTAHPRLYIIVNGKLVPDFDLVADGCHTA